MKSTILSSLLILAFTCAYAASAALYKGLDSEGNVVFSDKRFEDAEKIHLPPISVIGTSDDKAEEIAVDEEKPAEFKYRDFDIVSPKNNQIIESGTAVAVSLYLKPGLNTEKGHSVWLLVNGKPQIENSQNLTLQLGRLDKGMYNFQAQVRDNEGEIIVRTRTTFIYMRKISN